MMPVGKSALRGAGREIRPQPLLLSRAGTRADVAVEYHDVPDTLVVAVVALAGRTGRRAEVLEVPCRPRGLVLDVSGSWTGTGPVSHPRRLVAAVELAARAVRIDVVTQGKDSAC